MSAHKNADNDIFLTSVHLSFLSCLSPSLSPGVPLQLSRFLSIPLPIAHSLRLLNFNNCSGKTMNMQSHAFLTE